MDPQDAIDLSREAIRTCIFVGGPILVVSLLIGLLVSLLQSMTQLHDQSISFAPKILLLLVAIAIGLPWLTDQMLEFTQYSLEKPVVFQATSSRNSDDDSEEKVDSKFAFQWATPGESTKPARDFKPANGGMPMLRSNQISAQPQFQPQPAIQPRIASPFVLPAYRSADSEAPSQPSEASALGTKTF